MHGQARYFLSCPASSPSGLRNSRLYSAGLPSAVDPELAPPRRRPLEQLVIWHMTGCSSCFCCQTRQVCYCSRHAATGFAPRLASFGISARQTAALVARPRGFPYLPHGLFCWPAVSLLGRVEASLLRTKEFFGCSSPGDCLWLSGHGTTGPALCSAASPGVSQRMLMASTVVMRDKCKARHATYCLVQPFSDGFVQLPALQCWVSECW